MWVNIPTNQRLIYIAYKGRSFTCVFKHTVLCTLFKCYCFLYPSSENLTPVSIDVRNVPHFKMPKLTEAELKQNMASYMISD